MSINKYEVLGILMGIAGAAMLYAIIRIEIAREIARACQ